MGFRSNFITEDMPGSLPQWFIEKYPNWTFRKDHEGKLSFPIAQLWESKFYQSFNEDERILDIQKALKETTLDDLIIILLHECGGITRIKITPTNITAREPVEWKEVKNVEHDYCYGCSDISESLRII